MKLLLADDEKYTREGLYSRIDWNSLGIHQVELAGNGLEGMAKAREFYPDIILTDVRMPKMDGITMAFRIREYVPDCSIIFMSGYSDKEYLKAAIKLAAVSYVEKPLDEKEIQEALQAAVKAQKEYGKRAGEESEHGDRLWAGMKALMQQEALKLTRRQELGEMERRNLQLLCSEECLSMLYTTWLVQIAGKKGETGPEGRALLEYLSSRLHSGLKEKGLFSLYGIKEDDLILLHIGEKKDGSNDVAGNPQRLLKWMQELLDPYCCYYISCGSKEEGAKRIYESYNNAVILLQQSFFGTAVRGFLYGEERAGDSILELTEERVQSFQELLYLGSLEEAGTFVQNIVRELGEKSGTLVFYAKDYFYRCMLALMEAAERRGLEEFAGWDEARLHERIWECRYLGQIEAFLMECLARYFEFAEGGGKQRISDKIAYYVQKHYMEQELSLTSIAGKFGLTASYLCIVFKKECGMTLTRYIAEYRIKKAKEHLSDPDQKIKEVASQTGYADSNYFIKVFRKMEGMTPHEYQRSRRRK